MASTGTKRPAQDKDVAPPAKRGRGRPKKAKEEATDAGSAPVVKKGKAKKGRQGKSLFTDNSHLRFTNTT